jgi:hypothetical protein
MDEQRHTFLRLPKINPQIGIKYVEDQVGVSLIFLCVAFLFCVGVSTLVCPALSGLPGSASRLGRNITVPLLVPIVPEVCLSGSGLATVVMLGKKL